jgi:hypothetical protein
MRIKFNVKFGWAFVIEVCCCKFDDIKVVKLICPDVRSKTPSYRSTDVNAIYTKFEIHKNMQIKYINYESINA